MPAANNPQLSRNNAAFAASAGITILFNTVLACTKDACQPLKKFMASLLGHDWTTQAVADVVLFIVLGLFLSKLDFAGKIDSRRLITFLAGAAIVAGLGLAGWYIMF